METGINRRGVLTVLGSLCAYGCGGGKDGNGLPQQVSAETTTPASVTGDVSDRQAIVSNAGETGAAVPRPAPEPPPDPEPLPKSEPVPDHEPLVGSRFSITKRTINLRRVVSFDTYYGGGRYERFQRLAVLRGDRASIPFHAESIADGGAKIQLLRTSYTLVLDGAPVATAKVPAGSIEGAFELDLSGVSEGWHIFDIGNLAADESCPMWAMYVMKGATGLPQSSIPVVSGTYELVKKQQPIHILAMVPGVFAPRSLPLAARQCEPFSAELSRRELFQTQLMPFRYGDMHRPNMSRDVILSTGCKQNYFWSTLKSLKPNVPLLDGPRGVGTVTMPTHLQIGRRQGVYFCDPWRVGLVDATGHVRTIAGYRHKAPPSHWEDPADLELIGDWSSIPEERRGFHEVWGLAWDQASLATDQNAAPINGEKPHATGPRVFVADSQNNRVCLLTFNATNHNPPKVSEFLTGLADPWDVACVDGVLYVSERKAHRIAAYDSISGAFIRVVVSGADLSTVDRNRFVKRKADLSTVQSQPCVGPEGLFYQDGWLYFGSRAMEQVKRVNIATGAIEVMCHPKMYNNSHYIKIALSDGTFGPRGTVFTCTWALTYGALPGAHIDGRLWSYHLGTDAVGPEWETVGYLTAVAVGQGRMAYGGAMEALSLISKRSATDPSYDLQRIAVGKTLYTERGYHLTHGQDGWGYHGLKLPWGEHAEMDYYLRSHGHVPG